jgi:hypothetical protein
LLAAGNLAGISSKWDFAGEVASEGIVAKDRSTCLCWRNELLDVRESEYTSSIQASMNVVRKEIGTVPADRDSARLEQEKPKNRRTGNESCQ